MRMMSEVRWEEGMPYACLALLSLGSGRGALCVWSNFFTVAGCVVRKRGCSLAVVRPLRVQEGGRCVWGGWGASCSPLVS